MMTLESFELLEPYLILDKDDGHWIGVRDDAPDDVKKEWEELRKLEDEGIDI